MVALIFADDRGPVRPDASRSVDPVGTGDRRSGAVHRLVDDRRAVGSGTSGSVYPIGADHGVARLGKGESAECDYGSENSLFHLQAPDVYLPSPLALPIQPQAPGPSITISMRRFFDRPSGVSFEETGCVSPNPLADRTFGLIPCARK
jgi:hypothetical protein